jgi:GNAT superfamily N-acetyltransferase
MSQKPSPFASGIEIRPSGYVPGAIGRITELHATYYKKHWDFDLFFEAKVATELSGFLGRFDPAHDGFWLAMMNDKIVGAVAIDGNEAKTSGARLRWFIVAPEYQGRGVGQRLLEEAVTFCRRANIRRLYLHSFAGLDVARHVYEKFGFVLREEKQDKTWGRTVTEQTFELLL